MTVIADQEESTSSAEWLRAEYIKRKNKNAQYTLRSFARQLEVPPGRVSELLSGKRRLTFNLAQRITDRLGYSPMDAAPLFELLKHERKSKQVGAPRSSGYTEISADMFEVVADWQYFAILNLVKLKSFQEDPAWIAKRLGISTSEVRSALDKLFRIGLLIRDKKGRIVRSVNQFVTSYGVPSAALKRSHKQDLERAMAAIDEVPLALRDITSVTFPADLSKIPQVKKAIKFFERRMAKLMATSEASAVYNINVQLVPVTKESA